MCYCTMICVLYFCKCCYKTLTGLLFQVRLLESSNKLSIISLTRLFDEYNKVQKEMATKMAKIHGFQ
jgi:hypothetical protein